MTYTVYFFIYGVKLSENFVRKLRQHIEEEMNLQKNAAIGDNMDLEDEYIDIESKYPMIHQYYDGDYYIGKELWSTDDCSWMKHRPCKNVPKAEVTREDQLDIHEQLQAFKLLLPQKLIEKIPSCDFYWCSGSS